MDGSSGCGVRESQAVIRSLVKGERRGGGREDGPRGIGTGHDRLGSIVSRRSRLVLSSNTRQYSVRRGRGTAKGLTVMASPTDVPYPRNDISTLSLSLPCLQLLLFPSNEKLTEAMSTTHVKDPSAPWRGNCSKGVALGWFPGITVPPILSAPCLPLTKRGPYRRCNKGVAPQRMRWRRGLPSIPHQRGSEQGTGEDARH